MFSTTNVSEKWNMQGFERMLSYEQYPEEKSRLWLSSFDDMTIPSSVVLRKQEFSAFLIFAVWTSSVTYLTFGKGELQDDNHFLSLYSYFSPCYLISHHSLFLFRWFTTVDALSLQCVNITKLKTWTQQTWFSKEGTLVL